MKKLISILLALLLCISAAGCAALAEADVISGNISAGGVAAKDASGALYFCMEGLKRLNPDGSVTHVADGSPRCLQAVDGAASMPARLPSDLLERVSKLIRSGLPEVERVMYDLTPSRNYAQADWK